jgi:hypothetical protein
MKRNSSIQVLTILMAVMFLSSGQIWAASASAPNAKGVVDMATVASLSEAMEGVGPDDSALVISGKVSTGGADYYALSVQPLFDFSKKPADGTIMLTRVDQMKSNKAAGYKTIMVFRDTSKNAKMWKFFQEFTQLTATGVVIHVKRTQDAKWEQWNATAPSFPKTYPVGPVQPK